MSERDPITIPFSQRIRWFRRTALPGVVFAASVALAGWLWQHQVELPHALGEVEALQMLVEARLDGQFIPTADRATGQWQLFDKVAAGQVLGAVDNLAVSEALQHNVRQLEDLTRQLQHLAQETAQDTTSGTNQKTVGSISESDQVGVSESDTTLREQALRFEILQLQKWIYRANYHRHRMQILRLGPEDGDAELVSANSPPTPSVDSVATSELEEMTRSQLKANLAFLQRAAEGTEQELAQLLEMHGESPEFTRARMQLTAPLQSAIRMAKTAVEAETHRAERAELRAPMTGYIVRIHRMPGQVVDSGAPVLTVAAEKSQYVISYVAENHPVMPATGGGVTLRLRTRDRAGHYSIVETVGPQVEQIPDHLSQTTGDPRWGIPVRIKLPPDLAALPGSLVDVTFRPSN